MESCLAKTPYEQFYGVKADSWDNFKAAQVDYSDVSVAGWDCPFDCNGDYYLTSGNTSHYTHTLRGINYQPPGA